PHPSHPSRTQVRTVEDACLHMLASCPPASKLARWLHWLHHAGGNGGHNSPSNPPPPQYFTSWSWIARPSGSVKYNSGVPPSAPPRFGMRSEIYVTSGSRFWFSCFLIP